MPYTKTPYPRLKDKYVQSFREIVSEEFCFLEKDYGFSLLATPKRASDVVVYINPDIEVGIRIQYEAREAFVIIFICRLLDGEYRETEQPITMHSQIFQFDFGETLQEHLKMNPVYEYGPQSKYYEEKSGLRNYVRDFATRLQEYGKHFLLGDMAIFPEMERRIRMRAIASYT